MIDRRMFLGAAAIGALAPGILQAAPMAQPDADARLRTDWPWLARYAEENQRLIASGDPVGIVFMGDSITEGWRDKRPGLFYPPGRINRGIGGQTTPQMLLRMMADVVTLRPRWMHLMAGTNDIAGNTGPISIEQSIQNLTAMCQIARANDIEVLLASIPPASHYPWRPGLETVGPIRAINDWARRAAPSLGATYIDYWAVLADRAGGMKPGFASDEVHPMEQGYVAMESILAPRLARLRL